MSDLSIYELEDIWEDFERSGDHIVPQPSNDHGSDDKCEDDSCKKPRHEERDCKTLNKGRDMMEEDSWSHIPDGVFAASGDAYSAKGMPSLQSGFKSGNITSGSELCTDEGILKDTSGAVDSNSYDDLNLFSNDGGGKESSDLLYYSWPDMGSFDDVDRMLSNCDSSFGLGITGNDDELVWFTSEDQTGGYDEAFKMDLKFPCTEPNALTNASLGHELRESDNKRLSLVSESKDEFKLKDKKEPLKQLKNNDIQIPSSNESDQGFTNKISGHDSIGYMQSNPYLHPSHDHVPMQTTSDSMITDIKSENKFHSMDSSGDQLFQGAASQICGRNKVHNAHAFQPSFSLNQKQFHMSENKTESQSGMEGVKKGVSAELGSLDVPQGSSISSELDEISLEPTSFRQLQQVMEQLDLRTKLCIRDSLYRLARSAEQRHNYVGISDSTANCGGSSGPLMTEETKYTGLMHMETDTNPIDRTIAHLLFHRPSDSSKSKRPTHLPLTPNAKVHESTSGPAMVAKKLSFQQLENESDDKISGTGKN